MTTCSRKCCIPVKGVDGIVHHTYETGCKLAVTTYKQRDLEKLSVLEAVTEAASLWAMLCAQEVAKNGDRGSCVIGAGIGVWMVPAGKRNVIEYKLLDVPWTAAQGSFTWESSMPQVIKRLAEKDIDAHIIHGRLD